MICIGIDPDMHKTAIATTLIDGAGTPHICNAWVVKAPSETGRNAILQMNEALHLFFSVQSLLTMHPMISEGDKLRVVVEHQDVTHTAREGKNPQDIVNLSTVSGSLIGLMASFYPQAEILLPSPREWKKSEPKRINQPRTYTKFGWSHEIRATGKGRYAVPTPLPDLPGKTTWTMSDWKHIGDALGLSLHGAK